MPRAVFANRPRLSLEEKRSNRQERAMFRAHQFIVELMAPRDPVRNHQFVSDIGPFLGEARRVSLTSKATVDGISGFDHSWNLADRLLREHPQPDILFHLTCRDLNKVNLKARLMALETLGVRNILLVTGDHYNRQTKRPELYFVDSTDLLSAVKSYWPPENIAVAGYPDQPDAWQSLRRKVDIGVGRIFTQCISDWRSLRMFQETLESLYGNPPEIVPSVAIFKNLASLERAARLTRFGGNSLLVEQLRDTPLEKAEAFSRTNIVDLCRKCRTECRSETFNMCTFNQYEFTRTIIQQLTDG